VKGRIRDVVITYGDGKITASGPGSEQLLQAAWRHVLQDLYTNACVELKQFILARGGVIEEPCTPADVCTGAEGPRFDC